MLRGRFSYTGCSTAACLVSLLTALYLAAATSVDQAATAKKPVILDSGSHDVAQVAFSHDGKLLLSADRDNTVILWNPETGKRHAEFRHESSCSAASLSHDGKILATGVTQWIERPGPVSSPTTVPSAAVKLWDVESGKELVLLTTGQALTNPAYSVVFSPDGKSVALGSRGPIKRDEDGQVVLWNVEKRTEIARYSSGCGPVFSLAYSSDGKLLAAASGDHAKGTGLATVWDLGTGKVKFRIKNDDSPFVTVSFSPDAKTMAVGGGMGPDAFMKLPKVGNLSLWDVGKEKELACLKGVTDAVRSVAFSPDGTLLASAGGNQVDDIGELILWDVKTQKKIGTRTREDAAFTSVSFSSDAKRLAVGNMNGKILLWQVAGLSEEKPCKEKKR